MVVDVMNIVVERLDRIEAVLAQLVRRHGLSKSITRRMKWPPFSRSGPSPFASGAD